MIKSATPPEILHVCRHLRADDRYEINLTRWSDDGFEAEFTEAPGCRVCVARNGVPVCVFGVVPLFPGVGQAWLIGTDDIGKSGVEVAHACKTVLNTLLASEMHRIQACSADFHTQAHVWLEMLGFRRESVMRGFAKNGTDFYCYVIAR
jgi:hypothetical protein